MMNSLFRNIKENKSLDALEESDDEDEFENVNIDKFVDLSKKIKMKCVYNYKFKKWTPIARMMNEQSEISISLSLLINLYILYYLIINIKYNNKLIQLNF